MGFNGQIGGQLERDVNRDNFSGKRKGKAEWKNRQKDHPRDQENCRKERIDRQSGRQTDTGRSPRYICPFGGLRAIGARAR